MGIHGLTTFIQENPDLLQDFQLHDTKVVIDGNNLYHQLFYHYHVNHHYNGDYDQFALKTKQFFHLFKSCNISPIIVFDGGYDTDDRKLQTTLERARTRLHLAGFISHGDRGKVLPILAYETFRHVLIELDIPHVTCDFEADSEIVVLANDLNCPVISMDSDFYIFEVQGGYIPFDSINHSVHRLKKDEVSDSETKSSEKYIPVQIYFTQNLVKKFPDLKDSVLPLIATMLGNDFISVKKLAEFYSKLKVPKAIKSDFFVPKAHTKMIGLLNWLEQTGSIEQAVEKVLNSVQMEKRKSLKVLMEKSIAAFSGTKVYSSFNIFKFISGIDSTSNFNNDFPALMDYEGVELPYSFCVAHRKGFIPVFMLNAILLHRIILLSQVEEMKTGSAYDSALKLRRIIYGILLKGRTAMDESPNVNPSRKTHVEEYDREIKNIKKSFILPLTVLPGYGNLPSLHEISSNFSIEDKTSLLSAAVECDSLSESPLPPELKVVGGSVLYWVKNASPPISKNSLKTLLVGILILNIKRFLQSDSGKERMTENCVVEVINRSSNKQLELVQNSLKKYFVKQEHSKKNPVDVQIVHAFAQFQSCVMFSVYINQILSCPIQSPNPAHFFNGTFLYNFCKDLNSRANVDLFILEMLVKSSPLLELYNTFLSWVVDNVDADCFAEVGSSGIRRKKKKRKSKEQEKAVVVKNEDMSDENSDSDKTEKKQRKVTINAACSLTNRFQLLDLDDM